jgi:hypothetical protein
VTTLRRQVVDLVECIPCYNETWAEMEETLVSIEENLALIANLPTREFQVLSLVAIVAQLFYAAPSHLVCTISGYRQ